MKNVLVVGTGDTKERELRYVQELIEAAGVPAVFVDVGTTKFVVLPLDEPGDRSRWETHLAEAAQALLPLEVG